MSEKTGYIGFGFMPEENSHHFLVCISAKADGNVMVFERFSWQEEKDKQKIDIYDEDKAKAEVTKHKWRMIETAIRAEFNARLKFKKKPAGRFSASQTPVDRMLGKEMLVLIWAIEDSDPASIPAAIRNWLGLSPEERWWLYTMTNAATGNVDDRIGWRKALRYALCENPVEEERRFSLIDALLKRNGEE